jgi:hypothetical protein
MLPFMAAAAVIGLGLQAFGTIKSVEASKQQQAAQQQITQKELQAEGVRKQAMELDARRRQLEVVRNRQRARSIALTNATNQGSQFGSGLQGGYGQISGMSGTNLLGINQAVMQGQQMFDINAAISQQRIAMSQAASNAATAQGWTSFGGSLLSSAGNIGRLGGFTDSTLFGGGGTVGPASIYSRGS